MTVCPFCGLIHDRSGDGPPERDYEMEVLLAIDEGATTADAIAEATGLEHDEARWWMLSLIDQGLVEA